MNARKFLDKLQVKSEAKLPPGAIIPSRMLLMFVSADAELRPKQQKIIEQTLTSMKGDFVEIATAIFAMATAINTCK